MSNGENFNYPPQIEEADIDWGILREIAMEVLFGQNPIKNLSELKEQLNKQAQNRGINPELLEYEFLLAIKEWSAPSFEHFPGH